VEAETKLSAILSGTYAMRGLTGFLMQSLNTVCRNKRLKTERALTQTQLEAIPVVTWRLLQLDTRVVNS